MSALRFTHIGGPTVLIEVAGWRLLTDPTFDPPGRHYAFGWGTSSKKITGPALAEAELGRIDAVLLTHDHHADNLDDAGRALLGRIPTVVTTRAGARRLGTGTQGLAPWATTRLDDGTRPPIQVQATPCRHGPPLSRPIAGEVIGFALRLDGQPDSAVWITGDTVLYHGVRTVARRLRVGTAILHLGGVRFPVTGPLRYSMTGRDAAELCGLLRPTVAFPVHYEGWSHFKQSRAEIESELASAPHDVQNRVRWLPIGSGVEVDADP